MTDALTLWFALLTLVALAGAAVLLAVLALAPISPRVAASRAALVERFGPSAIAMAATVATVSTLGSLYLSEVADFVPCRLCWLQRAFMYPIAAGLWGALWLRLDRVWRLALPWALIGAAVSVYHYAEQRLPSLSDGGLCDPSVPCNVRWVEEFGFVTIPFMALAGFLFVAALLWLAIVHASTAPADTPARVMADSGS